MGIPLRVRLAFDSSGDSENSEKSAVDLKVLERNVARLDDLISGDVAYFSFGFAECGYRSRCFGSGRRLGEIDTWSAYTSQGRVELIDNSREGLSGRFEPEKVAHIRNVDFYPSEGERWNFNPVLFSLALAGKYKSKKPWHLFYFTGESGGPVFDWRMSRGGEVDYVELKSVLFVLPGIANIKRVFDVRKRIMAKEPAMLKERRYVQESERDHGHWVEEEVPNPEKREPSITNILSKFGYYPQVAELAGGFLVVPRIPVRAEFESSIEKIAQNAQLSLPLG